MQAEGRAGDGHARPEHHVRGAAEHGVVRVFSRFTHGAGFLISADQEDRIVGCRGDRERHQQVGGESGELDDVVIAEEGDHATGGGEFEHHHRQRQQHGDDRPVDHQQHRNDHHERDGGDELQAAIAGDVLIGHQGGGPGDVGLHPVGRGHAFDDLLNRLDRLVGQRFALVTG